ncbi:Putative transcriptional regulator%2C TetR family [Mycobacteroides abscessus]|nr:Putative transcriptional regulator%2C TetR family [Mycobacteroides abscessus]
MREALQWCAVLSRGGRCGRSRYIDLVSKRLSRTESQELTRAKLIESATRLYLENGYVATSTDQVAEAAGFSRGALYSNFRSKEDLALAVLDAHTEEQFQEIAAVAADLPPERFTRFETWLTKSMGDRRWALFKSEVALSARANPELRQQLAARDQLARQALSVLLGRVEAERETRSRLRLRLWPAPYWRSPKGSRLRV